MIEVNGTKLYDSNELSQMLGVSLYTITKYRREKLLAYTLVGRKKYTSEEALKDYLNGKTWKARAERADSK